MMNSICFNKDILEWDKFPDYDIIWCDPPWEQRMVSYFETLMAKNGQLKPNHNINKIIEHLAKLSDTTKPVFIEYSVKGVELIIDIMTTYGHTLNYKTQSLQENGNPYLILAFNSPNYTLDGSKQGFSIIHETCKHLVFKNVFDPFAGIGKTAKAFIKNGKIYIGSEININRFEKLKKVIWHAQQ